MLAETNAAELDGWVFGCDVCQDVCPWNRKAPPGRHPELDARPEWTNPDLIEWLSRDASDWKARLRGTALSGPNERAAAQRRTGARHQRTARGRRSSGRAARRRSRRPRGARLGGVGPGPDRHRAGAVPLCGATTTIPTHSSAMRSRVSWSAIVPRPAGMKTGRQDKRPTGPVMLRAADSPVGRHVPMRPATSWPAGSSVDQLSAASRPPARSRR